MKKTLIGVAYAAIVVLALVAVSALNTWVQLSVLLPLIGQDWAETVMLPVSIMSGGLVGYFGCVYWDAYEKKAGV